MKKIILKTFLGLGMSVVLASSVQATDFSDEPVTTWKEDGYPLLKNANGILKVIDFTNAAEHVNKGNYTATFKDPFDNSNEVMSVYVNVTRADNSSPMYMKVGIKEGDNNRYVFVKVNKGVSSTYPLGDFEMITYALKKTKPFSDWNTTNTYDRAKLVVSANNLGSTVKIAIEGRDYGNAPYSGWMNLQVDDSNFTSGHGTMNNWGNLVDVAFDDKYILDKNNSNGGTLSHKSQFDSTNYEYKLFNTDGSKISLATNEISSFSFVTDDGYYGFIGSNYENNTTLINGNNVNWSGKYYLGENNSLNTGDSITTHSGITYKISAIDKNNGLIMLAQNGVKKDVSSWEGVVINGKDYSKSGDKLYPPMDCSDECNPTDNLIDNSNITISGHTYKVKAITVQKTKKIIAQRANYTNLDDNVTAASDKTKVNALEAKVSASLSNPNLTFDTTDLESVKTWFDSLDTNKVPLKVLDGKNIE